MENEDIEARKEIKKAELQRILEETRRGYDYSKKPEYYSMWDWCGQCNRSLRRYDDDTCDCVDWDEENGN